MLEAKVHNQLREFTRFQDNTDWIHQLTMGRMVARGLRLKSSTIIQTGINHDQYYFSYLIPALLSPDSLLIVVSEKIINKLINQQIPFLKEYVNCEKIIIPKYPDSEQNLKENYQESLLYVINFETWFQYILTQENQEQLMTIIVNGEELIDAINQYLTLTISSANLANIIGELELIKKDLLREKLATLLQSIYSHPPNPDDSYLLDHEEVILIKEIIFDINKKQIPAKIIDFLESLSEQEKYIHYFIINRKNGSFLLKVTPLELKDEIKNKWQDKNLIIIANYLAPEKQPLDYGNYLGLNLDKFICLKFSPNPQSNILNLYFPDGFPFPNNPHFATRVNQEILALISGVKINHHPIIVIIDDVPLQGQITANLAANFGSRVKLKNLEIKENNILVCDTNFYLKNLEILPSPQLLIIATLPLPSLENPLISAQVTYFKRRKKDWFRLYLLPIAIKNLQRMTIALRQNQGVLALLDNRVNYRSYGTKILQALEPYGKINYLDLDWLN